MIFWKKVFSECGVEFGVSWCNEEKLAIMGKKSNYLRESSQAEIIKLDFRGAACTGPVTISFD